MTLLVSVGITNGVPATGMTVPLGPITVPAGILAGLTAMPALAGLGWCSFRAIGNLMNSRRKMIRCCRTLRSQDVGRRCRQVTAGNVAASAASTIPCLVKCIFQQAKVLEGKVFPLLLRTEASRKGIVS